MGVWGLGAFTQTGGANISDSLLVGEYAGSCGTYNLTGNSQLSALYESIGEGGAGAFTQSGGTSSSTYFSIGDEAGSNGTYNLSGGQISAAQSEVVGSYGTGTFTQSGGTNSVSGYGLYLGGGGSGAYNLNGGQLFTSSEIVGNYGTGSFTQSGGTHTVSGSLTIAANAGSSGTYMLQGGTLNAGAIVVNTGGTLTNSSVISLTGAFASATPSGGSFTQTAGGVLNAQINGAGIGQVGRIVVGSTCLAGSLNVTLGNGFTPVSGEDFPVLSATSLSGSFVTAVSQQFGSPANRVVDATSNGTSVGQFNVTYANNSVSLVYQPLLMLANLCNNIYNNTNGFGTYSYINILGGVDPNNLGFRANAYQRRGWLASGDHVSWNGPEQSVHTLEKYCRRCLFRWFSAKSTSCF